MDKFFMTRAYILGCKRQFLLVISVLFVWVVNAQVTFEIASLPTNHTPRSPVYISGNFEGWSGGSAGFQLSLGEDSRYRITLPQRTGTIQFKFTRGSWATVEKGPNGEEIANRTYTFGGNGDTVQVQIATWSGGQPTSTAAENVHIYTNHLAMPPFPGRRRTIRVYLPPQYEDSGEDYPVLYMKDGQNLFDVLTSFAGEWEVDETLNRLYTSHNLKLIVVGVDNGLGNRIQEYTPWAHPTHGGGRGDDYLTFVTETLMPYVESIYRVKKGPEYTGIMGSSLGGLISHYAGLKYPDIFGKIGVFSPSFWFSDSIYNYVNLINIDQLGQFYLMAGSNESTSMVSQMEAMVDLLIDQGLKTENIQTKVVPGGMHNENLWRQEFEEAVLWLFNESTSSVIPYSSKTSNCTFTLSPNPADTTLQLIWTQDDTCGSMITHYRINGINGQLMKYDRLASPSSIPLDTLPAGTYILSLFGSGQKPISKIFIRQ
jgi:predicted alpha/beta superfamily hydrolase